MGLRYILYRVYHIFLIKSKLIKWRFPTKYADEQYISLAHWKIATMPFFFQSREALGIFPLSSSSRDALKADYENIRAGKIQYFNHNWLSVGFPINWHHNPDSGYEYPKHVHWAYIPDLSAKNGDIKYVWEKSRFSFLYTIIRYDQHFGADSSAFVFDLINDWIAQNPINQGPNYKCSQEISLRLLNWTFALYYYKNSPALNEASFSAILNSMRQQLIHVYKNIHFSRITVRNNHAITETLCLYLISLLFPCFSEAKKYQKVGKKYFEEEIAYQVYADGSYLQFSMNYHRVVVQLLTWALHLSEANKDPLSSTTLLRVDATLQFLYNHQDAVTGYLPNYGANDGALFFKLNQEEFLNHAPQINALSNAFTEENLYTKTDYLEDAWWYSGGKLDLQQVKALQRPELYEAKVGGFYVMRHPQYFSMLRCGNHKDRPQQADANHLDIWYEGKNIVRDNGSYKYNTDADTVNYFSGTASHNTVQVGDQNQMLKGGRFIWYFWSQAKEASLKHTASFLLLHARAKVYQHLSKDIVHTRTVKQYHEEPKWEIEDEIILGNYQTTETFKQNWHLSEDFFAEGFVLKCYDKVGQELLPHLLTVWNSQVYGEKHPSRCIQFQNKEPYFITVIYRK